MSFIFFLLITPFTPFIENLMSEKIKPSEVSEVLQRELQGINDATQFDEVGTVLTVADGVAHVYGLRNVEASELLEFENGTMLS